MRKKIYPVFALFAAVASVAYLFGSFASVSARGIAGDGNGNSTVSCSISIDGAVQYGPDGSMQVNVVAGGTSQIDVQGSADPTYDGLVGSISSSGGGNGISVSDSDPNAGNDAGQSGNAEDDITVGASTVGTTGSISINYKVDDNSGDGGSGCSTSTTITVDAVAAADIPIFTAPANLSSISPCFVGESNCPMPYYYYPGGDGEKSPVVPSGGVVCGVMSQGNDNKGYPLANEPIVCPITQQARSAGLSLYDTGTHVDSSDNGGSLFCPDSSNIGAMTTVAKWGKSSQADIMDCGFAYAPAYGNRTYVEPHSANQMYFCPTDSMVSGAINSPAKNDSWYEVQCTQVLFAQSQVPPQSVAISISPTSASVGPGGSQQFAATVTGSSNTAVSWTMTPQDGTLSSTGLYTAPSTVTSQFTVTVTATSAADPTKSASVTVTVSPTPPPSLQVTLTPSISSITLGQQVTLTVNAAEVNGNGGAFINQAAPDSAVAKNNPFINVAEAFTNATSEISCNPVSGSDSSGNWLPSKSITPGTPVIVTPANAGNDSYVVTCRDHATSNTGSASTTINVSPSTSTPTGTITVASFNAATDAPLSSVWTFTAPGASSLNGCSASSGCSGTSAKYVNQPAGATSTYTIAPVATTTQDADGNNYAFDSSASSPNSYTLQSKATDNFNLAWDPLASITVTPSLVDLSSSTPSANVSIKNSGAPGSTLNIQSATTDPDASSWLTVGSLPSGIAEGSSVNVSLSANVAAAPSSCSAPSGCSVTLTFTGTSGSAGSQFTTTAPVTITLYSGSSILRNAAVSLWADPASIAQGSSTSLLWNTVNAASCVATSSPADSNWSGSESAANSSQQSAGVTPATSTVYTLTCQSVDFGGNPAASSTVVNVSASGAGGGSGGCSGNCPGAGVYINASPASIPLNATTTVTWTTSGVTSCSAYGNWSGAEEPLDGSQTFRISSAGTYTYGLECVRTDDGNLVSGATAVTVTGTPSATLSASPTSVRSGAQITINWSSANVNSCVASSSPQDNDWSSGTAVQANTNGVTPIVAPNVTQTTKYTYGLSCASGASNVYASQAVTVIPPAPGCSFSASPATIAAGASTKLVWNCSSTQSCAITGIGEDQKGLAATGNLSGVDPTQTATYTLSCTGDDSSQITATTTVTVGAPGIHEGNP